MTKKKWLIVLLAVLLAAAVCLFVFWDAVAVYLMPKAVLTKALSKTISQLQERYSDSPISLIASNLDSEGRYTAQMELETENELVGEIIYDMSVQMDTFSNRLLSEGVARTSGNELDLSVYMDKDFMALSSDGLLNGAYYGITYDSFSSDIRGIPLLKLLIGEQTLSGWDASVANIQAQMAKSYRLPDISEVSDEDVKTLLTAILLLPSDVEQIEMQVGEEYVKCHRITYSAVGEQVEEILGYLMDTGHDSGAVISASFCLYENSVIHIQLQGHAGGNSILYMLELPPEMTGTIMLRASCIENGEETGFCVSHNVEKSASYAYETWNYYQDFQAAGEGAQLTYRWEPVMGELVITQDQPITLNMMETESGFRILTDDFDLLMVLLSGKESASERNPVSASLALQKGAEIITPDYKNLDVWSLDDLLTLVGGVGSLFGLKIG